MNQEQRAALRKVAEEATPGPWLYDETELPAQRIHHPEGFLVARIAQMRTDGRHIAAANPSAILQLLDYIETLESESATYASNLRGKHSVAGATYATMQARIETLEKEAARYRWSLENWDEAVEIFVNNCDPEVINRFVDAAMQGETE